MNSIWSQPRFGISLSRAVFVAGVCVVARQLIAQEALNESVEVEQGRRARKEAIDRNLYNLKAGPVLMRFDALMGFEINDNPQLVEDPEQVDFAFRPQLDIATLWAWDARNALALNLGIGYVKYIHNTDLDHFVIAPSSEIALDIYTGDVTINLHERISHSYDPVRDPSVSGTGDFGGIENTVGTRVDWDLNHVVLSGGYDHFNFISTSSGVGKALRDGTNAPPPGSDDAPDRSSELFYTRAAIRVSPAVTAGVESGFAWTDYDSEFFHDNWQFTVGPFVEAQITRDLKGRAAAGYLRSDFRDSEGSPAPETVNDFYAELSAEHQVNQFMKHRLALGREARAGAATELLTMYYARYENHWSLGQHVILDTTAFYENGRERGGGVSERFQRVGAGAGVTVPLSRKLNVGAGYQLLYRDSDQAGRDYLQNSVTADVRYAF